ncbi:putative ion transporter superfamily protein YfcC [Balneicella halophila]|uniref:Putative ion transporter superfamily protein YfcC n=1 Tax=Balneicella halophila TaxID=1537566 RepID=A0A7L4US18_BALHA|nr:YfcC family protein [Balneicella halophila]PVX52563.1 putative ion transporter superfamily protein YfcC [Balneicella halophila]
MKRKLKFPTPYTVLMIVIALSASLTFLLPSGSFNTLRYDSSDNEFVIEGGEERETVPATQEELESRNIYIELNKFKEGKIKKPVSIPGTYKQGKAKPQGLLEILYAPLKGIYDTIDIILFVLILGGFIGVFNSSGAFNEGVGYLAHRLKGREGLLIILITTLIALGGTSFGLAEETLAFYPILVPVFLAAGYDLLVPVAVIYTASCIGTMASTTNPFATIIASDAAGVDWTVGMNSRIVMLVLGVIVCIIYVMRYASKIKKDPTKSLVYGVPLPKAFAGEQALPVEKVKRRTQILLTVFALTFIVMIYGVSRMGWWFQEMTALFLVSSVIVGVILRLSEEGFINEFLAGAKDLLGVAFIIGIARGVTFILNEGQIADTILFYATNLVEGMPPMIFLPVLMFVYSILTLFIASSSGMAVVTMPIMGSLATVVGVEPQEIVNTFLFGMGLMSFITPTGLILPSLAMVNVNYKQWLKFIMPLLVMLGIIATLVLWGGLFF